LENVFLKRLGDYVIRRCEERDIKCVISVNWATLPEHYSDFFFEDLRRSAPESFLVAEKDGEVVGYVMCRIEYGFSNFKRFSLTRKGHIVSIAVLEEHRGCGLGRELLKEALEGLRSRGCSEAYLEVRRSNSVAVHLYEKLGFKVKSVLNGYYQDGDTAYLMVVQLI